MSAILDLTIAVIAKECLPGKVKTRLSPPLSPREAARLAQLSLSQTLDTVRHLPVRERWLVMDGTPSASDAKDFVVLPQASGGLDERLAAVCDAVTGPLLIVGMDTPQFSSDHLAAVFRDWATENRQHEAWFGPAADGGFWALALANPRAALIRGVRMSTDTTGEEQLARLTSAGLSVGMLPELRDMDFLHDAVHIAAEIPGSAFAGVVTGLRNTLP